MKKIISILLCIAMLASTFLVLIPASAEDTPLSFKSGFENLYIADKKTTVLPKTIEATINAPSSIYDMYEGDIIAWYDKDTNTQILVDVLRRGSDNKDNAANLSLRILCNNGSTTAQKIYYTALNDYVGQKVHIAFTFDTAVNLYINGTLYSQNINYAGATDDSSFLSVYNGITVANLPIHSLGGDNRLADSRWGTTNFDNYRHFKGKIYNACAFSDVRTANEISSDKNTLPSSAEGILFAYNVTNLDANALSIPDLSNNGYTLYKGYSPGLGFKTGLENVWSADKQLTALPLTYEATIKVPTKATDQYKGDILAMHAGNTHALSALWDIHDYNNGETMSVRFLCTKYTGSSYTERIIVFKGALDSYIGQKVHLALTVDTSKGEIDLYVNGTKFTGAVVISGEGNTAQTKADLVSFYASYDVTKLPKLSLGGDLRKGDYGSQWTAQHPDNFRAFHSLIYNACLFTDVRTGTEISADIANVASDTANLLAQYDTAQGLGSEKITDNSGNGYNLKLGYGNGMTFTSGFGNIYSADKKLTTMPLTYEAIIRTPSTSTDQYKGDILAATDEKREKGSHWFLWDVHIQDNDANKAHIRFLCGMVDANGNKTSATVIFEKALNGFVGKQVNIAMTFDTAANAVKLYINGNEFSGTISCSGGDGANAAGFLSYYKKLDPSKMAKMTIGGDYRAADMSSAYSVQKVDNWRYFHGQIYKVAAFSDVRNLLEVRADKYALTADQNLMFSHNAQAHMYDSTITDESGNGYDFKGAPIWLNDRADVTGFSYSFAVVGDTQVIARDETEVGNATYSPEYAGNFDKIYDWILQNKDSKNIKFSFHMGDVTDHNGRPEWELAMKNINKLSGVIPNNIARGNHDGGPSMTEYYTPQMFIEAVADGEEYGFFDGRGIANYEINTLNAYQTLTVGNVKYLMLSLDMGPCTAVIEWANEVIASHPYHNVIISTHSYLHHSGAYMDEPIDCSATMYNPGGYYNGGVNNEYGTVYWDYRLQQHKDAGEDYLYQDASYMFNNLVKKHANVCMVLCGHEVSDYILNVPEVGDHGNKILQFLVDPQGVDRKLQASGQGHAGLVAMFYISEDGKSVTTEYYSTIRDQYYKDIENCQTYEIDLIEYPTETEANDKLDGVLDSAKDLNENDYSVEDWNTILAAIEKAKNVSGTPADVMVGATELESIISNTTKLDRSELNAALILAQSKNQSDYTPESWAMLTAALEAANNTKNTSRVQAEIDTKAEALTLALNSLQSATPDNSENDNNNNNSNSGSGNNNSDNTPPKDNTPETDKSVETDKTTETEKSADTDEAKKNGCGSAVTVTAIALVAILTLGTGITFKKKED